MAKNYSNIRRPRRLIIRPTSFWRVVIRVIDKNHELWFEKCGYLCGVFDVGAVVVVVVAV